MKFTLHQQNKSPSSYWNGSKALPSDIHVMSYEIPVAEFELLTIICSLHGYVTAFDILTGAQDGTEKDKDIDAVMTAFQMYLYPRMPLSNYGSNDKRMKPNPSLRAHPIDASSASSLSS
jgi:hypothetical protein